LSESILKLIARVIEWCKPTRDDGPGHPPTETMRVLATLRRFLREGTLANSKPPPKAQHLAGCGRLSIGLTFSGWH